MENVRVHRAEKRAGDYTDTGALSSPKRRRVIVPPKVAVQEITIPQLVPLCDEESEMVSTAPSVSRPRQLNFTHSPSVQVFYKL